MTAKHPRSAGNGALMRSGIVGLSRLHDREMTARAAVAVASLTHADPLVADSCVLHAEAIRVAVLEGRLDLRAGLDLVPRERRAQWEQWIDSAAGTFPASIEANRSTFGALRATSAAITSTDDDGSSGHARRALIAAVRAGHDTDTIAAITGALVGARID
ncbi:ADP-ribosylglycohydrolase family protein [Calidifontibacter indicus]|uniref:ADP-ribosylglycohydrolase family protein n=1 Tax=Calidifontibacter indicus TaxID=419650 RepID=UPI0024825E34|nr:ADP-ribosylglycohydrolase family protein [Calidifontibacter indicus]